MQVQKSRCWTNRDRTFADTQSHAVTHSCQSRMIHEVGIMNLLQTTFLVNPHWNWVLYQFSLPQAPVQRWQATAQA